MWENRDLLDGLRTNGADVRPSEPGVASVRIPLPQPESAKPVSALHGVLRVFADRVDGPIGLKFVR